MKTLAEQRDHPQPLLPNLRLEELDWQWRAADDGFGEVGVAITALGTALVVLSPNPEKL